MNRGEHVQWRDKGFWHPDGTVDGETFLAGRHTLFDGTFTWPAMVLRDSALIHNLATLKSFADDQGLLFAPHGKTTMAPALFERQLAAGAWGITLATANQVAVARQRGVSRILVANEILDLTALTWIATEVARDPYFDFWCYIDSVQGVEAVSLAAQTAAAIRGFDVLVDLGFPNGRTGCRNIASALDLARTAAAAPSVNLAGVAGYEGGLGSVEEVASYLADVQSLLVQLYELNLVPGDAIVTAGGSAYFDVVAHVWASGWPEGLTPRKVLRSGAYVSHDDGVYLRKSPYARHPEEGHLEAAIEVWAQVISPGDCGRVIVGMGKRDAPYDEGMPTPLKVRRSGSDVIESMTSSVVERMDDHHAYLSGDEHLVPGDLVCFGISHPCTAFDKWQLLPLLDEEHRVVDLVRTFF